jgi:hypothetical protein
MMDTYSLGNTPIGTCCTYDLLNSQYSYSHFDNYPIAVSINNKMEKTIKIDLWSLPKILFINGVL